MEPISATKAIMDYLGLDEPAKGLEGRRPTGTEMIALKKADPKGYAELGEQAAALLGTTIAETV